MNESTNGVQWTEDEEGFKATEQGVSMRVFLKSRGKWRFEASGGDCSIKGTAPTLTMAQSFCELLVATWPTNSAQTARENMPAAERAR